MRSALFVAVALFSACKGEPFRPDAAADGPSIDAYKPPWFFPAPGTVKNWDIQLAAPFDFATARAMMVVELWDVVPAARQITYDDASTVNVPAGAQPTAIATLKAAGTTVICHVGLGAVRLDDPDATKLPGYEANPPNRPTPVAAGSAIGWSTTTADANERFVDFRNTAAAAVLKKRVQLAKDIGCDGILAYRMDAASFVAPASTLEHGFSTITSMQETQWIVDVAKLGHDLMISVGGRGAHAAANLSEIVDDYDWLMAERCTEVPDCDATRPFIEAKRAVFGLDYDVDEQGNPTTLTNVCADWVNGMIDGVMKTAALDASFRMVCP